MISSLSLEIFSSCAYEALEYYHLIVIDALFVSLLRLCLSQILQIPLKATTIRTIFACQTLFEYSTRSSIRSEGLVRIGFVSYIVLCFCKHDFPGWVACGIVVAVHDGTECLVFSWQVLDRCIFNFDEPLKCLQNSKWD